MVTTSEPFDGRDRRDAGAARHAVEMHGAGAALRDAAAIFGAGQLLGLADDPEQRRVGVAVEAALLAIEGEIDHGLSLRVAYRSAGK